MLVSWTDSDLNNHYNVFGDEDEAKKFVEAIAATANRVNLYELIEVLF